MTSNIPFNIFRAQIVLEHIPGTLALRMFHSLRRNARLLEAENGMLLPLLLEADVFGRSVIVNDAVDIEGRIVDIRLSKDDKNKFFLHNLRYDDIRIVGYFDNIYAVNKSYIQDGQKQLLDMMKQHRCNDLKLIDYLKSFKFSKK